MERAGGWWLAGVVACLLACAPAGGSGPAGGGAASAPAAAASGGAAAAGAGTGAGGSAAASSAPAAAPTAPADVRAFDVAVSALSASATPLWVADEQGIFSRYGLAPEFNTMSPAATSQAIEAGSVPVAISGGSSVTAWLSGASDRVFIAGVNDKPLMKILSATPGIERMEDLRGRSVASTSPGSGGTMAVFAALRHFNVEPERDAEVTYLRDQPTVLASVLAGNVAAGGLPSPFSEQARASGARLLVDVDELGIRVALNHVTSTRGMLERERDFLRRFVMAYVEGLQYARDNPEAGIQAIMHGTRQDSHADAEQAYQLYRDAWSPWIAEEGIQTVLDNTDLPAARTARPADIVDLSLVRELEASGWLAAHYRP
ncbi:MAG TPA: ABC transporter substrate-binding protein [Chloroflexota bacterium]|jgi:ABC-type nitrate/sulfonate/bicarbonate transport system substrate-binding protein